MLIRPLLTVLLGPWMMAQAPLSMEPAVLQQPPEVLTGVYEGPEGVLPWRMVRPSTPPPADGWPVLLFLHGCTQNAEDAARGTGLDEAATARGWTVLYAEQPESRHPFRCWNWYETAGFGEVSLLMAMLNEVATTHGGNPTQHAVAGMSAGGAMAMLLATEAPEHFLAVISHSGVAPSLVENQIEALQRMQGIPAADTTGSTPLGRGNLPPLLLIHGDQDDVVSPLNLTWAAEQWRLETGSTDGRFVHEAEDGGRTMVRTTWGDGVFSLMIQGLGHAWSGGNPSGTYVDPAGPAVTAHLLDFLQERGRR